jgi:hypothetical protein
MKVVVVLPTVDVVACIGSVPTRAGVVAGVPYSQGLDPFAQGPHIGFTSSHLVCRLRQMVLLTYQNTAIRSYCKDEFINTIAEAGYFDV